MNFRMCDYSILSEKFPYSLYIISGDQPNRESNIEINSVLLALKMIWKFIGRSCVILNYQFSFLWYEFRHWVTHPAPLL